ncbi:MAG: methionyl-tRNA formyltransferase [Leptospirales bacterium]
MTISPKDVRVVFMGTPSLSVPFFESLVEDGYSVAGVVTQPDRPVGRGYEVTPSPVRSRADLYGIPVMTPETLKTEDVLSSLFEWKPDVIVVVAYGKILPKRILEYPRWGCINVHASLLPKLRGASPIQWAIRNDFSETGLTLMKMDEGMDTGPVLSQVSFDLSLNETTSSLTAKMMSVGPGFMRTKLNEYLAGRLGPVPQEGEFTVAPLIRKEQGRIPFGETSRSVDCHVRAMTPWPGAFCGSPFGILKILSGSSMLDGNARVLPGTILDVGDEGIRVSCGEGSYRIHEIQKAGGRRMPAREFLKGNRLVPGTLLS